MTKLTRVWVLNIERKGNSEKGKTIKMKCQSSKDSSLHSIYYN